MSIGCRSEDWEVKTQEAEIGSGESVPSGPGWEPFAVTAEAWPGFGSTRIIWWRRRLRKDDDEVKG
jgi:hypothetical protein